MPIGTHAVAGVMLTIKPEPLTPRGWLALASYALRQSNACLSLDETAEDRAEEKRYEAEQARQRAADVVARKRAAKLRATPAKRRRR